MARRQYSDVFKANALAALAANGGNVSATARALDVPRKTLESWAAEQVALPEVAELRREKKRELADELEDVARALIGDLADPDKRYSAGLQQTATAVGIVVDKMRLLRGESTDIQEVRDVDGARQRLLDRLTRAGSFGRGEQAAA